MALGIALRVLIEQGFDLLIQCLTALKPLAGLLLQPREITAAGHVKTLAHGRQAIINSMFFHECVFMPCEYRA